MIRAIKQRIEKKLFHRHWLNGKFLKENNLFTRFQKEIYSANLFRLRIAVIFSLTFLLVQYFVNNAIETPWTTAENLSFFILDSTLFILMSFIGVMVFTPFKQTTFIGKLRELLPNATVLIIFLWGGMISSIESRYFEFFPTYSLIVIVISWYFLIKGSTLLVSLIIGFSALIFGHHLLPSVEKQPDNYYQIVVAVTFISWIVSRTLYHNREQIFVERVKLEIANQSLEKRVEERTTELTVMNEKLSQEIQQRKKYAQSLITAKQKAEESDRLKSAFLANMSHEIRTPMNGIIGFSSLLQKKNLPQEKADKYLYMIQNNCKQLLVIIDDILDLSKIEAHQIKLKETTINAFSLLEEVIEVFRQYIKHIKKDHLVLTSDKSNLTHPPYFIGDLSRIQQILYNFMRNAIKFTQEGSITLGIIQQPKKIIFYVADTGIGIPKEKQPFVFDRFYQGDDSVTRKQGGAGLGLAISRGLADLMAGKIWFESEEFKGSTFYFSLPHVIPDKKIIPDNTSRLPVINNTDVISHKHILIVEDEYTSYLFLKEILDMYNAKISHAVNGHEALEICRKKSLPDLVLMDIQLPEMDGFETTHQLKNLFPQLPVIAQTANITLKETDTSLFNGVILKPIYESKLINKIVEIFQNK